MPNIDTSGPNLSCFRHHRARNMLGRLRAAAAVAPLVLTNGNFYTANDLQPRAAAAVVVDGRITFVGATPDALRRAPPGARRLDLHGATVLPGLGDAHAHPGDSGERELTFLPGGNEGPRGAEKQAARACRHGPTRRLSEWWRMDRITLVAACLPNQTGPGYRGCQPPGGAQTGRWPRVGRQQSGPATGRNRSKHTLPRPAGPLHGMRRAIRREYSS
jgi:hypothetical protein